jgi:biotin carboxyl carrier protein
VNRPAATSGKAAGGRPARFTAVVGEVTHQLEVVALGEGRFEVSIDGRARVVDSRETGPGTFSLLIDHATAEVSVVSRRDEFAVAVGGRTHRLRLLDERALRQRGGKAVGAGSREVRAVMPGKVVAVLIETGAQVVAGQGLLVIEAMKMENEIAAPRAGTVQEIRVSPGQAVEAGEILAIVE